MRPPGAKVFLATERVDGRKGINGLSALVRSQFAQDPLGGQPFVFFSRRADHVRVLYWDRDGYVLTSTAVGQEPLRAAHRQEKGYRVLVADPVRLLERTLDDVELRIAVLVLADDELRGPRRRDRWAVVAYDSGLAQPAAPRNRPR